ncbi:MAG: GntR family transcriptional regulator, partial [Holophagales bacterium]|nr:GntR family transcriptional regulator [Holophagales bacterium]
VRELAKELRVNPRTVSKAYRRLADRGVLTVRRGEGTFVSARPPQISDTERSAKLYEAAVRFTTQAHNLSASEEESVDAVRRAWHQLRPHQPRPGWEESRAGAGSDEGNADLGEDTTRQNTARQNTAGENRG